MEDFDPSDPWAIISYVLLGILGSVAVIRIFSMYVCKVTIEEAQPQRLTSV